MIDPRFASGYGGAQQMPMQYHHHHHHRHHGHPKNKNRHNESPISRDESIHKVDHGHHFEQNDGAPVASGYGVPYGTGDFQQQQFGGRNFGYGNQYQGDAFGQDQSGVQTVKHRRRHHRQNRHHTVDAVNTGADHHGYGVPEQLIGQRSSSVLSNQSHNRRSPATHGGDASGDHTIHRRHRHHRHHHHGGENASFGNIHQSLYGQGRTGMAAADGYGHINQDLIFIERGDHSPHRQEPPAGYDYKGKIEVQNMEKEQRAVAVQQYVPPPPQPQSSGPCPPGWTPMVLTAGGGSCASGGIPYSGQIVGAASSSGGYGSYGGSYALPSSYQYSTDYTSGYQQTGASGYYPQCTTTGYTQQSQATQIEEHIVPGRPTIIEVWQKRQKREKGEKPRPASTPPYDFDKLRNDILAAIGRIPRSEGGTQTQVQPRIEVIKQEPGEVRVIVQPIQPVFYMPRQSEQTTHVPAPVSSAPNVVYVPRNVYVPVIKPVFVPRERVIVRPQVIHVARPVLVDRPVPVTQRPIIIDRERPVPVPVRSQAAKAGGSRIVKEEFVYRDNLPVAYGGRCAEFTGGATFGYVAAQAPPPPPPPCGPAQLEVLDAAVNPSWIKTDQSSLVHRYGRPAYEIVHKSEEVEQQMYSEIRHRSASGGVARSGSTASYVSGSGLDISGRGGIGYAQF